MNRATRLCLAAALAAGLVSLNSHPASAQFDAATSKCRSSIARSGAKLARTELKALSDCHDTRNDDPTLVNTDCNFLATGDLRVTVGVAEAKFARQVLLRCGSMALGPADALYESCPAPCNTDVPTISNFNDVAACLICLTRARVETFAQVAYMEPQSPLEAAPAACHRSLVSSSSRFFNSVLKDVAKCQADAEKEGATSTENCTDTSYADIVGDAYDKAFAAIDRGRCSSLALPDADLDPCGSAGSTPDLATCVLTAADSGGQDLVTELLGLPVTTTTTTSTTTTTVPVGDSACPATAQIVLYSRDSNTECTTDADCDAPRTCDASIGKCTTNTDVDSGWTGYGHGSDTNDEVWMRAHLYCEGPAGPTCGECTVLGVDPAAGNCRCANDSRKICYEPFAASSNDCAACIDGPLEGGGCSNDSDCHAGTCARRCSNDVSSTCSSDGDCPGGTCRLLSDKRCSNGSSCETASDCTGTCSGPGGVCDCYLGAPTPVNSAGTPTCIVDRLAENISGTTDVDLGSSEIASSLRTRVYLGEALTRPCPTCGGICSNNPATLCDRDLDCGGGTCTLDTTAGDGVRDGTCTGGASTGLACDVTATNASFPANPTAEGPSGGGYSLDCMPSVGRNVSGAGLVIDFTQTTGTNQLASNVSCTGSNAGLDCACLVCSADSTVACNSDGDCSAQRGACSLSAATRCDVDGDCAAVDAGTCRAIGRCSLAPSIHCAVNADCDSVSVGTCRASTCSATGPSGETPAPNGCGDLLCTDLGGGEGECTNGPDVTFCDGVVTAAGTGILPCAVDDDCAPGTIGIDGGHCTLSERLGCFLDPIVASGNADPEFPITAATFCLPPTSQAGVNAATGRPGPGRVIQQTAVTTFCASNPSTPYTPGVGGCP